MLFRSRLADTLADSTNPQFMDVTFRSGWEHTDREMAGMVRDLFDGRDSPSALHPLPTNPLDWSPSYSLGDALQETALWLREQRDTRAATFNPRLRSAA